MKIAKFTESKTGQLLLLGLMGAGVVYYTQKKARELASDVGEGLNPNSKDNIVNRGVNAIGETLTGDENFILGGWFYDLINGTTEQQAERAKEKAMIDRLGG